MSFSVDKVIDQMNRGRPYFNWNQECERLIWYGIWAHTGSQAHRSYSSATLDYRASRIDGTDPYAAPRGAVHFWEWYPDGHVGWSLGNGLIFMTGDSKAVSRRLDRGGSINYGTVDFNDYQRRKGHKYLGWTRSAGGRPSLVSKTSGTSPAKPTPKEDDVVTKAEIASIAEAAAAAVWRYEMEGGKKLPTGGQIPTETAGERLRQARRSTNGLMGRTLDTQAEIKALRAAVETLAKANGLDQDAVLKRIDGALKDALAGLEITLTTSD
jgi:hypothetical protein